MRPGGFLGQDELAERAVHTAARVRVLAEQVARLERLHESEASTVRAVVARLTHDVERARLDVDKARREAAQVRRDLELSHQRQDRLESELGRCRSKVRSAVRKAKEASRLALEAVSNQEEPTAEQYLDVEAEEGDDIASGNDDPDDPDWIVDDEGDADDE